MEAPGILPAGALTGGLCFRYGSYMVWKELGGFSEEAVVPLGLYAGQLTLNWAWPPIFFGTRQMGLVSVDLACLHGSWTWFVEGWASLGGHGTSHTGWGQDVKVGAGLTNSSWSASLQKHLGDQCPPMEPPTAAFPAGQGYD